MKLNNSLKIQEPTYIALRALKFYDKIWELTSFRDGGYAEFREASNDLLLNDVARGIRIRGDKGLFLTLVEFPVGRPKYTRVSTGAMSIDEEENGDWARLEVHTSYDLEHVLQFFYNFPLRSRIPSEGDSHRLEYNHARSCVEHIIDRVMRCATCFHENDGGCSYYLSLKDRESVTPKTFMRTYMEGDRITLVTWNLALSLNLCRYSEEELYRWMIAFRMALDSISRISPSCPTRP